MKFLFLKDDFDLCIMDVEKKLIGIYKSFYVYSVISFWLLYLNVLLCMYGIFNEWFIMYNNFKRIIFYYLF